MPTKLYCPRDVLRAKEQWRAYAMREPPCRILQAVDIVKILGGATLD